MPYLYAICPVNISDRKWYSYGPLGWLTGSKGYTPKTRFKESNIKEAILANMTDRTPFVAADADNGFQQAQTIVKTLNQAEFNPLLNNNQGYFIAKVYIPNDAIQGIVQPAKEAPYFNVSLSDTPHILPLAAFVGVAGETPTFDFDHANALLQLINEYVAISDAEDDEKKTIAKDKSTDRSKSLEMQLLVKSGKDSGKQIHLAKIIRLAKPETIEKIFASLRQPGTVKISNGTAYLDGFTKKTSGELKALNRAENEIYRALYEKERHWRIGWTVASVFLLPLPYALYLWFKPKQLDSIKIKQKDYSQVKSLYQKEKHNLEKAKDIALDLKHKNSSSIIKIGRPNKIDAYRKARDKVKQKRQIEQATEKKRHIFQT